MPHLQLTIPAQKDARASVKIKPREVQGWLENLPFLDLRRTARLAREQLSVMNRQRIPVAVRLPTLGAFLATYQRLEESGNADPELKAQLKYLGQNIGFGYKIVAHELVNGSAGFMETRNLPLALLGAIHMLGLQLLEYYANYRRAPRALWSECLALYAFAWQQGRETYSAELPGYGEQQIDRSFRLIALLRLADPYHLPAGMARAMRRYFEQHLDLCAVHSQAPPESNCFELTAAFQQNPPDRESSLCLEVDALLARMHEDLARLSESRRPQTLGLAEEIPVTALLRSLQQTADHWRHHPTRNTDRQATHARVELVCGLQAVYCMVNQGRCFDPALFIASGNEQSIDLGRATAADTGCRQPAPEPFDCSCVNHSSGGLAVRYCGPQSPQPRVGQLLAVRRPGAGAQAGWVVAVCRWLMQTEGENGFELGLQYLAREPNAVVLRRLDGNGHPGPFEAAIAATQKRGDEQVCTLITGTADSRHGNRLVIYDRGRQQQACCEELLESGPAFERIIYAPAQTTEAPHPGP